MARILLITIIIISFFSSCKENNSLSNTKIKQKKTEVQDIVPSKNTETEKPIIKERFIEEERELAQKEINIYLKNKPKPILFLTNDYYIVDYISDGAQGPKDMIDFGEWYKFKENFEYEHGFFEEIKDQGKYSYAPDKKALLMLPDDKKVFPSEWRLLNSGDVIVLVGTPRFSNNPLQKHMQNVKEKPVIKK